MAAVETAYMKQRLVESNLRRLAAIEAGEQTVVGVNAFTEAEPSPLSTGDMPMPVRFIPIFDSCFMVPRLEIDDFAGELGAGSPTVAGRCGL